jgi:SAM-dependent methyltransferase
MDAFYSQQATRRKYQVMVDAEHNALPSTESAMRTAILTRKATSILEVGCGSGRIYRRLRGDGFNGSYTGLEVSPDVVARNEVEHPEANWIRGSIYTFDPKISFDVVFAYFVLEHCVYPVKALERMVSLVRPGGVVILVFPDFVESGRLASQPLGFVGGRAKECLRRGDVVNAVINLCDSRIRLRRSLRRAVEEHGLFPVNLRPRCLIDPEHIEPDVDAVYIASKREVRDWAVSVRLTPRFPEGTEGNFRDNTLIELET